ncbi:phospholipase D family protein [Winogradskyella ouciana]|uniref:Phospholipase D-like domain-containing protein n=1 Tax=Winogradskyella ouciana TaxID=2608631 RepID=A0A7K1GGL0_9FLAO|nr:phospholipase D family protein [Winogradskyella ouciana]MTE27548.1 hypothetical protein [Winogradskyella ouciana]
MSTFLTGKTLENKLTDIIWKAKKYVVIVSPFIKLDDHIKEVLDKIKSTHGIALYIVFGKNEEYKHNSFKKDDLEFIKEFKNVTILYNKDLHAKHYANEREGLITSLNLYGYSMVNNIEYGVYFEKTPLNPIDKLFEQTYNYTFELVNNLSTVIYLKKPTYSNKLFGLTKQYQESKVIYDITDDFFDSRSRLPETKSLKEFDLETETIIEKKYSEKPQRVDTTSTTSVKKKFHYNGRVSRIVPKEKKGFCIRTGEEIPYNPDKPMSYDSYMTWVQYENYNFPENYCHKTGKPSYGKTSMANPILTDQKRNVW